MMEPAPKSFHVYAELLSRYAGLKFAEEKSYLLRARLGSVMRREECAHLDELAERMTRDPLRLERDVAEALLNNETFFFRDRVPFDQFTDIVLPRLRKSRQAERCIRIWSAACSTGQEPYSLAMLFEENAAAWAGWKIEILASDLSLAVLARAREGLYTQFEVQRGLSTERLLNFFQKEGDQWRLAERVRARVKFQQQNLIQPFRLGPRHDVVFARNVLMYFDKDRKAAALHSLRDSVAGDGLLVLGAAETMFGCPEKFVQDPACRGYYVPAPDTLTTAAGSPDSRGTAPPSRASPRQSPCAARKRNRAG